MRDYLAKLGMKTLLIVICAGLFIVTCAGSASGRGTDELLVSVRLTTGERSKDSGSQTRTITVERDAIAWAQTFAGSSRRRPNPPRKVYKLSPAEKRNLLGLVNSNDLLVTDSIELPRPSSNYQYLEVSIDLTLGGKKGAVNIRGPRNAAGVKDKPRYRSARLLIEELYRIMNGHDESVHFEELILDRTGR